MVDNPSLFYKSSSYIKLPVVDPGEGILNTDIVVSCSDTKTVNPVLLKRKTP